MLFTEESMASCRHDTNPLAIEADIAAVVKQLAEIKHYREIRKSKQHAANSLDKDVAWMVFEQEIKAIRTSLTGLKIAYSTASAINQDSPLITLLQAEEAQASSNRILAHQASRERLLLQEEIQEFCEAEVEFTTADRIYCCKCERWDEHRLLKRAEEVVERDALGPMPRQEQQQRVRDMQEDLRQNHECEHSRRFERIEGGGRRGFTCEMCEARYWKFILECRRCHLRVCQECRCHRI
ncbi:hypothetical protein BO99DRAFT_414891 [Aspergillus violaceofuscus CBS 115571]|uniref:Uncharacterized protein n=1 Tax=Aspergillus violaceofuscus (strain CBS 115571) TaxID=1450538 RepID=A0A2V5GZK0_ASPV1|nr:hypothetical protein BO99DRAFT_414891 [Aspergillus violaceofuscus CBS 115571]